MLFEIQVEQETTENMKSRVPYFIRKSFNHFEQDSTD